MKIIFLLFTDSPNCQCSECLNSTKILSSTVSGLVPKIKCSMIPGPVQDQNNGPGASSWTYGYQIPLKHNHSFSSVDEEDENTNHLKISPPSKSRLSLNLVGKDKTSNSPRSPRKLSKFLRSSFSKLMQIGNSSDQSSEYNPSSGMI